VDNLGESFRLHGVRPFDEIEEVVRYNLGDELGKQAMDLVWNRGPRLDRMGEKRAEVAPTTTKIFGKTASDVAAKEMIDLLKKASDAEIALADFEKVAVPVEQHINGLLGKRLTKEAAKGAPDPTEVRRIYHSLAGQGLSPEELEFRKMEYKDDPSMLKALQMVGTHGTKGQTYGEAAAAPLPADPSGVKSIFETYVKQTPGGGPATTFSPEELAIEKMKAEQLHDPDKIKALELAEKHLPMRPSKKEEYERAEKRKEMETLKAERKREANEKALLSQLSSGSVPFFPKWIPELISEEAPAVEAVTSPKHEAQLRKVKIKLMVNDMISNDPTLSSYAPAEVIDAVNKISAMAPSIATNAPLMQSLVRRMLQKGGELDPSEFGQIMQLESAQRSLGGE
jgi:hypothetical protein